MGSYITGFSVYTLAMLGVIFVALVVVKKCLSFTPQKNKNNFLRIENCLNLEPRKNLYVVRAGREKFLIASAGENCRFMTKLGGNNFSENINFDQIQSCESQQQTLPEKFSSNLEINSEVDIPEIKPSKILSGKYNTGIF